MGEGILHPDLYSEMLVRLAADHCGSTFAYFWDLPLEETLRRHATRPQSAEVGEADLRRWWMGSAYVDGLREATIGADETLDEVIRRIESDCGWS